jgi:hypothetical protein
MLGFDFQLRLAPFANPMMLTIDKCVIVNSVAAIRGTNVTLHGDSCLET